jgi:DNA-binding response OmpR family regulator
MRERLQRAGFAADIAYTAAAALARADATRYAVILVDLQLSDGDGIGLILGLRAKLQHQDTPLIVVSVDPIRSRDDVRSSNLNVSGWLCKPVDFEQLVLTLKASIAPLSNESPRNLMSTITACNHRESAQ